MLKNKISKQVKHINRIFLTPPKAPSLTPNTIPNVGQINFTYDAAGNRLSMTYDLDGPSRCDYTYDTWSRLTSEARQFAGITGTWTFQYDYNLAGELKSLTDAFDQRVDYTYN